VFSPYYAYARRFGDGDPYNHCAINVALYGRSSKHWALTERGRADLSQGETSLIIGPSSLDWDGTTLTIAIDEVTVPFPSRIRGTVRVSPSALTGKAFTLDDEGRHRWQPIAPSARIEVAMRQPALSWAGNAYLDANFGDEPLEAGFIEWNWGRAQVEGGAAVLYDIVRRDRSQLGLALKFDEAGRMETFEPPPQAALASTLWRVGREARSENAPPRLIKTLEDTPFYARSLVGATLLGTPSIMVHESLSLDRVANPIVRAMLPFRMPRRAARRG
jgi:carotenoid 1,2-hydratase